MAEAESRPVYVSSPWVSDFVLLQNHSLEFAALFPRLSDQSEIRFSEYLKTLSTRLPVRIITTQNETSEAFFANFGEDSASIEYRFAVDEYHEKGLLAPFFYIEGSMNFTYHGLYVRGEKITYYCGLGAGGAQKILGAYMEFDRRWDLLGRG